LNPIMQGLSITVAGLATTFLALGIFILVMTVLQKLFPGGEPKVAKAIVEPEAVITGGTPAVSDVEAGDSHIPVVIAAAVSYFRGMAESSLGTSLETGKSSWWTTNRISARQGLGIRIKRSGK